MSGAQAWELGDLALCVKAKGITCDCGGEHHHDGSASPPVGAVRTVVRVDTKNVGFRGEICRSAVLYFDRGAGLAVRFVKVTPLAEDMLDREDADLPTDDRCPAPQRENAQ